MNNPTFGTFRGWSIENDKWVYGIYSSNLGDCDYPYVNIFEFHLMLDLMKHDLCDNSINYPACFAKSFREAMAGSRVHPESLAMFTGLKDTNDIPIYGSIPLPDGSMSNGGDILKSKYTIYKIYYDISTAMFRGTDSSSEYRSSSYWELWYLLEPERETTIIGNGYE